MNAVRYLFFDLDGTLFDDDKRIENDLLKHLRFLKSEKGLRYALSTGRHEASVVPYLEQYGLWDLFEGMVCNSGADLYWFKPWRHEKNFYLEKDQIDTLIRLFSPYEFLTVAFHFGRRLIATRHDRFVQALLERNHYRGHDLPENVGYTRAPKCLLLFEPEDEMKLRQVLLDHSVEGIHWAITEPDLCELLDDRVSKASGALTLIEPWGGDLSEVMVFGDAENDRQIVEEAGISVCMANGDENIKAMADYVTEKTNNENGILHFLLTHNHLLKGDLA